MKTKHNKKRNVGIVYELFLRHMSNCIINNDKHSLKNAAKIIEKRFAKDTELYKEFRLFNALAQSKVTNSETAAAIIYEAKQAARRCNVKKLEKEKSDLIRDINYKIKDSKFYYRNIPDYKDYGTIQNTINEWKKNDKSNLKRLIELERKIVEILLKEKKENTIEETKNQLEESDSNKLVVKIMTEKINNKYKDLTLEQKEIVRNYALYHEKNNDKLVNFLCEKKIDVINQLNSFETTNKNKILEEKINRVKQKIENLSTNNVSDTTIVKFLTLTNLINELKTSGDKDE